ncbi:hypothetical protein EJ06DRAFT_548400 [Trichodelitschia bisporula]|uniref:Phosphatidic acid phosphatase type 2/haloperoxidase domain-containing protein n=1 Tax=Trichodelitschia bisporula TaxID=703511 RepID=A0A6G1HZW4_9PEZI|nr:hypothetical protein EJ06DRAFT_548400 [Trichodelitschia bisporula]
MRVMGIHIPSKRLIASYIFDWICIILIAVVGRLFSISSPYHRPFSLTDLSISFPYIPHEKIPTWLLMLASIIAPAIIVFLVSMILVPGPTVSSRTTPRSLLWRRKFWEWNTGWMGLALASACAYFFTQGMKNLAGKPRPSLLARCQPDVGSIAAHRIGGYATGFNPEWTLVNSDICRQPDKGVLDDGFKSFPSGHASTSWAGLLYLTLFLCSKFSIAIPFLASDARTPTQADGSPALPLWNRAAAPPTSLLALAFTPLCVAAYITFTRYFEFYHAGVDLLAGTIIGCASAWFAFRWYHLPIRRGAGWAWGARSRARAFGIGVGVGGTGGDVLGSGIVGSMEDEGRKVEAV